MSQRLVVTNHRPLAGQELNRCFAEEKYAVYAVSPASAWPVVKDGQTNQAVLDRQPTGLTCCILDDLRIEDLVKLLREVEPRAIVHAPLHGVGPSESLVADYESVVTGTLHWLEAARQACPRVPFIFLSSSQVYGDRADTVTMSESDSRIDFTDQAYLSGLMETFPIEGSTHSMRGAAAVAADVLVQEYFRSHHVMTCCLRIDALCDPGNGVQDPRDFLSLITHCNLTDTEYTVRGHQGRQVREVVAARDVATLIEAFIQEPQPGEIYNVGGSKTFTCSQLEAIQWIESLTGKSLRRKYTERAPLGEPRCYYSNPRQIRYHFPKWKVTESWKKTAQRIVEAQRAG